MSIRRTERGDPVGAGLLVTPRHVLTCAHVVRPGRAPGVPEQPVFVRFQYASAHDPLPAAVVPGGWHPDSGDGTGDVAVLELGAPAPPEALPAPLRTTDPGTWDHRFRAYGYPEEHRRQGVPVRGEIIGHAGSEWLQVEAAPHSGWGLEKGFSGSPVWDVNSRGVIGMLVARDTVTSVDRRTAYAIKVETLVRYWPELGRHVKGATTTELRDRLESLLWVPLTGNGEIPRVGQVNPHDIGVARSKYSGSGDGDPRGSAPYVPRRAQDDRLDELLANRRFVLLAGRSKAGKSRTLYEALLRTMPGARLVVPRPDSSGRRILDDLSRLRLPTGSDPVVLWLDDLHRYLQPGGLDLQILDRLARREPGVTVVATIPAKQRAALTGMENDIGRIARTVLNKASTVELPSLLAAEDAATARETYPREDFTARGIGELMVAAPSLELRFTDGIDSCPAGWALARAASDWLRMGVAEPLPEAALRALFASYMAAHRPDLDADEAAYRTGLAWAREPVAGTIALLHRTGAPEGPAGYAGTPYLSEYLDTRDDDPSAAVPRFAWEYLAGRRTAAELLPTAYTALVRGESETAERMLLRVADGAADRDSAAWATLVLGEMYLYRADFAAAADRLERAAATTVDSVVPLAQVMLAEILMMTGDRVRPRELLESAVAARDPQLSQLAQVSLAALLFTEGRSERAEQLLESVVAAGDDEVAHKAQAQLVNALSGAGGDAAGVRTRQVQGPDRGKSRVGTGISRGGTAEPSEQPWILSRAMGESMAGQVTAVAQANLGGVLAGQGKLDRAEEVLRSVLAGGQSHAVPLAQVGLGELLMVRGRAEEAEQILRELIASGNPLLASYAKILLAVVLHPQGRIEQGMTLLREAAASGHPNHGPRATCGLGEWYAHQGDLPATEEWFERAIATGHPDWSAMARIEFAIVLATLGDDLDRPMELLTAVVDSAHPNLGPYAANVLGNVLALDDRVEEAERAYRVAIDSGHPNWSQVARVDFAVTLANRSGDAAAATELLNAVIGSAHPHQGPRAADLLGDLLALNGRVEEAERAYRIAIDSGHPQWSLIAGMDLAGMLADAGDYARAESLLRVVADSDDATAEVWARAVLGTVLIADGQRDEGIGELRTAAAADAGAASQFGRFQLAKCLIEDGEAERAEGLLRTVVGGEPSQVTEVARAYLAVRLLHRDADAAAELLVREEDADDEEALAFAYLRAAEYLLDTGEVQASGELLQAVLELAGPRTTPWAGALLGVVRRSVNDLESARRLLTDALAADDPSVAPLARRYLGSTLFRLGLLPEAEQTLLPLARSEDTEHRPQALLLLGRVLAADGRPEEAYPWLEQAIEHGDPDTEADAREVYAELLLSAGQQTRAREIYAPLLPADDAEGPERPEGPEGPHTTLPTPPPNDTPNPPHATLPLTPDPMPPPTPEPTATPSPTPTPHPLPPAVLTLLGDVAHAEGEEEEAAFWYAFARRAPGGNANR
ncbi:tetratricopeptide repeat-containing serine protease family protein [Streptomyces sp. NBC_01591]|uniref:tetratricopeptide repeat-containing serine protease family protein n=1 Tax=Streptomyces sp. NBC_01591 TaxID=2975888 RepID=UPI002DD9C4DC|nr:tetratricopeptide repeat-containing serine protease family protein [Streptomyces sp. NBC_01591]WSD71417.1 tetratricopeptide repeat-containing serine protease family protein [Streptomyces sp. NBC_01591]